MKSRIQPLSRICCITTGGRSFSFSLSDSLEPVKQGQEKPHAAPLSQVYYSGTGGDSFCPSLLSLLLTNRRKPIQRLLLEPTTQEQWEIHSAPITFWPVTQENVEAHTAPLS